MGSVDWFGVVLAVVAAMVVAAIWYKTFSRPLAISAGPGGLEGLEGAELAYWLRTLHR